MRAYSLKDSDRTEAARLFREVIELSAPIDPQVHLKAMTELANLGLNASDRVDALRELERVIATKRQAHNLPDWDLYQLALALHAKLRPDGGS